MLQQLEKHLEQPTRIAVEEYIKGMRETLKAQESNADAADSMLDRLSSQVARLMQIKIFPNAISQGNSASGGVRLNLGGILRGAVDSGNQAQSSA